MWDSATKGNETQIVHRNRWLTKETFLYDLTVGNEKIIGVYFATCCGSQFTQCVVPRWDLAVVEGPDFLPVDANAIIAFIAKYKLQYGPKRSQLTLIDYTAIFKGKKSVLCAHWLDKNICLFFIHCFKFIRRCFTIFHFTIECHTFNKNPRLMLPK